ncbi:MAG: Eco57I restriction-modification methylase domain-containing protein [Caulobacteraceae bacterium]|nr:Eco57I restriction-modification methylase domain-containing protein [Caulobacteraceae bacterium]
MEFKAYTESGEDPVLLERLRAWSTRLKRKETSAEGAFTQTFFVETWGYGDAGRVAPDEVTIYPKLRIPDVGAGGGMGEADLALGWFDGGPAAIPQVLCEFKDIRSALEAPQARKGNTRSPVKQCLDYVRGARKDLFGTEPVQPWWGLVTDMNEFRLYWWDRAPHQYLRFVIEKPADLFAGAHDLLGAEEDARFDRFLFQRLFHRDQLLSRAGKPALLRLIERQWVRERALEGEFYAHYKGVRERLFSVLTLNNPGFPGTPTELLRLSQKLLDRFIFAFYCEDMGERMLFPPQLIRNYLKSRSTEPFYDPNGGELWDFLKRLFAVMDTGGPLGAMRVPHINGGLFAADPAIEALHIPNHVFAAPNQGVNDASLEGDRDTLLYLCARYNYASRGDARESLSLYTLGRIFEQSITELEYREGELEGRDSLAALSERKRNGVYYTPEWVVNLLVEGALKPWFDAAKARCGWPETEDRLPTLPQVEAYEARLKRLRLLDPACGSGAFLIAAFRRLLDERLTVARTKAELGAGAIREATLEGPIVGEILENNIYGVDLNPSSVEITKLALWLHSARADRPLSALDHTIRRGNSLVGPDFWLGREPDAAAAESVGAFDWRAAFPEVWADPSAGGFDVILGNPPYVKLQNLTKAAPEVAAYLRAPRGEDSYQSARSGNFDLYLPFVEKGLRLLAPGGRMAYIAPSVWTVNVYGEGLRDLIRRGRHLDRWVDFKAYQIFDEAITYTALQYFTLEPQPLVKIATAPQGEAADVDWADAALAVPYEAFPDDGEWLMATGEDRALIDRLAGTCLRLDHPSVTTHIFQGLITSADDLYHLRRLGAGRYWCVPNPKTRPNSAPHEVEIEDAIMRPLISGAEAKRYEDPATDTYLLFPYERDEKGAMRLIPQDTMRTEYPKAWAHLQRWGDALRARETKRVGPAVIRPFDDEQWYRFGRNQNIDKQDYQKIIVAQTVPEMRVTFDSRGDKYLNNVRVNGIFTDADIDPLFVVGALNGPVVDFVFRRIGKPKQGGWFEANKQFIAPLPIPNVDPEDQRRVATLAANLQAGGTRRRELLVACEERLSVLGRHRHREDWLWPDLPTYAALKDGAPAALRTPLERREWAADRRAEVIAVRLAALQATLDSGARLEAAFRDGELRLFAGGAPVLSRIYLDDADGQMAEAWWRWLLLSRKWREAKPLADDLSRPPADATSPAAAQFIARVKELADLTAELERSEADMNAQLFDLYQLTPAERLLVENDRIRRGLA